MKGNRNPRPSLIRYNWTRRTRTETRPDVAHGKKSTYNNHRCGCGACRLANAEYQHRWRAGIRFVEDKEATMDEKVKRVQLDSGDRMLGFFLADHLPTHLRSVSQQFSGIAIWIVEQLPRNQERTVALRKLLEAKDCAVRAMLEGA